MADTIRKQIDLDKETVRELKVLAAHADKDVKNYIQDLIAQHVRQLKGKK